MSAWIRGRAVAFDEAVQEAAEALDRARCPLIAGLAADVAAIRAAFALGARIGASFEPADADRLYADLDALASAGAMTTSPSEMVARADLVLAVGRAAADSSIVAIARSTRATIGRGAGPRTVRDVAPLESNRTLAETLGLLRALATRRIKRDDPLADLAAELPRALYGVAVYDALELGDLAVEMLHGLAAELSEATRFFALPIAGSGQGRSALQVSTWTTGGGPRVGLGRGVPEHDPWRFNGARQVADGEVDSVLWLAALAAPPPAWARERVSVAIIGAAERSEAEVTFEVGVPGDTCDGVLWDERRAALAFHPAVRRDARPSAARVLGAIEKAILDRRVA